VVAVASRFHFAHHEHTVAPRNHIEFATRAPPISRDDVVALAHVPRGDEIFGPLGARHAHPMSGDAA